MPTAKLSSLMGHLGHGGSNGLRSAADGELLSLFVATRDEDAFTELVHRYGGLVFGVCRRVTGNHHLAEEAFQAVFVVLATKSAAVRPPSAVAAWLHGVAWRTANRARTMADRRRRREAHAATLSGQTSLSPDEVPDAVALLDEEIARLPEHYRLPLVLCELEGQTRKDVAEKLRIPEGTLSSRLAAARKRLANRLRQRGIVLSVAASITALGQVASARPPAALSARAALAATRELIPAHVAALSQGVLRLMFLDKLKTALPLAVMAAGLLTCATFAATPQPPIPSLMPQTKPVLFVATQTDPPPAKVDPKPLPKGPNKLLFYRAGHLTMMDPNGKNETKMSEDREKFLPNYSKLSPDGKKLAFLTQVEIAPPAPGKETHNPQRKLYIRELTEKEPGMDMGITCQLFMWSPDGTKIATADFVEGADNKISVVHHLVDVKTKEQKVQKMPDNQMVTDWTRDGKYFLTHSEELIDGKPSVRLHLVNMDGKEHKVLTDAKEFAMSGRISPDGTRVLYLRMQPLPSEKRELRVLDIATGKSTLVNDQPLNGDVGSYCWSPDGKRIAYGWRERHEGKPEDLVLKETESHLVVCDPDGKNQRTLASEKAQGQGVITIGTIDWR